MTESSFLSTIGVTPDPSETSPVLVIPYMWIGDFVRGHTVVRVLKERWPNRPVDLLVTSLCAPLVDYMPGVRKGIVWDLPRGQLALNKQKALAEKFRAEGYAAALVMPRTWKSALAPTLAGIPKRTGWVGEMRFGLINDWRWGDFAYRLPLADGPYTVELQFADTYNSTAGQRVFDASIEGVAVIDDFDIIASVGVDTAIVRRFEVVLADGMLDIAFSNGSAGSARLDALRVIRAGEAIFADGFDAD